MIIRSFDGSENGGFDPRNYAPLSGQGVVTVNTADVYTEVLNVTGEGFIDIAIWSAVAGRVTITVDGIVKTFTRSGLTGFALDNSLVADRDGSSGSFPIIKNVLGSSGLVVTSEAQFIYPYLNSENNYSGLSTASVPIFFYNSIKIAVTISGGTPPITGGYYIRGGLLI